LGVAAADSSLAHEILLNPPSVFARATAGAYKERDHEAEIQRGNLSETDL
jgi:hypothetical protein